jgi:hypothetical protein
LADIVGVVAGRIFEDGLSVPSERERDLRVAGDCEIRMIEQIAGFQANPDLPAVNWMPFCTARSNCANAGPRRILHYRTDREPAPKTHSD